MPHNGFLYEARMDMMESSGHWFMENFNGASSEHWVDIHYMS